MKNFSNNLQSILFTQDIFKNTKIAFLEQKKNY